MRCILKKSLSLFLSILIMVGIVPNLLFEAKAVQTADDFIVIANDICGTVNANMDNWTSRHVYWLEQIETGREIVNKITYGEKIADACIDTAVSLTFTLIPGYGSFSWVEWSLSRGIDVLQLGIYHAIKGDFEKNIQLGMQYCDDAFNKFMHNKNSKHKITDPNVAYDILLSYTKGITYLYYGWGFYNKIMSDFVEERSNKALFYTQKTIEYGVDMAFTAAMPMIKDMFPKLSKIEVDGVYEIGDLYNSLTVVEWKTLLSHMPKYFSSFELETPLRNYETLAKHLYNASIPKIKKSLTMSYEASPFYEPCAYRESLNNVVLTGNQRDDLVNVALSQVGYHEGNNPSQISGTNTSGSGNYTEYGYWFGYYVIGKSDGHFHSWCAMFISWCARQAGIPISVISNAAYAYADSSLKSGGYSDFHVDRKDKGSYTPQKGDLIFFGNWEHVGIVWKVENGRVYTIEGNNNNAVKKSSYSLNSSYIKCYGAPKYNGISSDFSDIYSYDYYNGGKAYKTGTYKVTTTAGLYTRSKPTANSTQLSSWNYGSIVDVTATDGNWGYTSRGWICLDYTQRISSATSSYNSNVSYDTGNYVVTTKAGLNCRKGVGTNTGIVTALKYGTQFSVTKTDGAWGYCPEYGGWLCLNYADYVSALNPSLPVPTTPELSTSTSSEIGVNDVISFSWKAVDTAEKYNVKLIDASTSKVVKTTTVSGTNASFVAPYAGTFNVSVSASNSQHTGKEATLYGFTAKAPLTVTFKNWDGSVISKQTVAYGKDATVPSNPSRTGYTFSKWDGNYKTVRENSVVTAIFTRNKYKVTFCDYDGTTLKTQDVYYGDAATAPSYKAPTGYSFVKWDKSFDKITKATNVKAVVSWTSIYPLEISTKSAVERNNKSYIVTSIVNNSPNAVSNAKVIAVLKTKENKLLATVESGKISLAKGEVKNLTLTATYNGMATKAEIFVVKADNEKIPLASQLAVTVDQGTAWSSWSTSAPPSNALQTQSRTEYRYKDKSFKTSTSSSLDGWTKYDSKTTYGSWGAWSAWQDSSVSSSDVREVKTQKVIASYNKKTQWRYSRYSTEPTNKQDGTTLAYAWKSGDCIYYEDTGWLDYPLEAQVTHSCGTGYGKGAIKGSKYNYWYNQETRQVDDTNSPNYKTQYSYRTRTKTVTNYFYQWGNWSSWGTTKYTANDNRQVQTRTTYRYIANNSSNIETTAGTSRTIKGTVSTAYAGRQALLFVSSKDGATQFLGQTKIASNGAYSFTFKLLSEPTVSSGDYNVTLSIEGTTAAIVLDPILAPVPSYKVKFVDHNGTTLSEQTIKQGQDAVVPNSPSREGYNFTGWDKAFTNIQSNLTVTAKYTIKSFDVVFVDELNNTSVSVKYNYGAKLNPPAVTEHIDYKFLGWDAVNNGKTTVKDNMVVNALFEKKTFTVKFLNYDGSVYNSQTVEYGDACEEAYLANTEKCIFLAWNPNGDLNYVTEDIVVEPVFEYTETVDAPTANIVSGEYNNKQLVTLSSTTPGTKIYYTLDGTIPNVPNTGLKAEKTDLDELPKSEGILYTGPFTVDSSEKLIFVAIKEGLNNSEFVQEVYAINNSSNKKHVVTVHCGETDEVQRFLVDDGKTIPDFNFSLHGTGYVIDAIYKDATFTNEWNPDTDVVKSSMDLYIKWKKESFNVKFLDSNGKVVSEQKIAFLEDAVAPEIQQKEGYLFAGWDNGYTAINSDIVVKPIYVSVDDITTIKLNRNNIGLYISDTATLTATVSLGKNASNKAVIWQSSDENVVTVDDNGNLKAIAAGTAIVYAVSEDSGMSAQCTVVVKDKNAVVTPTNKVTSVSADDISLIYKGSATITPTVNMTGNVNYTVSYVSSNPSVAQVDEIGNVYAAKTGSATITVTVTDEYGNKVTDTCDVNAQYTWWQWIIVIVLFGWLWY